MLDYQARTGIKRSYEDLSEDTNLSIETIKSVASRKEYNATLKVISLLSISLGVNPIPYFEWEEINE